MEGKKSFSPEGNMVPMSNNEFHKLSSFIKDKFGIKLTLEKKILLQGRLQRRLRLLNLSSFKEYNNYLFSRIGQIKEIEDLINAVSTNKTDFFRERAHFDFLFSHGLDDLIVHKGKRMISVWSAGCSSGEEPYTIAMTINEYKTLNPRFDFKILATDVSQEMLQIAKLGIYSLNKVPTIPDHMLRKYFYRGKNTYSGKMKVQSVIRQKIDFKHFNLATSDYGSQGKHDIIFCRNVLIYFDRKLQHEILVKLCHQLKPGGFLFVGHSESLIGFSLPLTQIKPTVYFKHTPEANSDG